MMTDTGRPARNMLAQVCAPFGTWEMDRELSDMRPFLEVIYSSTAGFLFVPMAQEQYVVKIRDLYPTSPDGQAKPYVARGDQAQKLVEKELNMMLLAGGCSVPPIGRVFDNGQLTGFIMPRETPIALSGMPEETFIDVTELLPDVRLRIVDQLHDLVRRLHFKNIVHGDIKPSNLLFCTDGELRFCDFENASIEGDHDKSNGFTQHYCSPSRVSGDFERPCAKSDDLYAVGISMWEIFTGSVPFSGISHHLLDDLIVGGLRPDLTLVNNHVIAGLINSYLDAGPPLSNSVFQTEAVCTESDISFKDCREVPPHTYRKTVHSLYCVEEGRKTCPKTYAMPHVTDTSASLLCIKCNPVQYHGLD